MVEDRTANGSSNTFYATQIVEGLNLQGTLSHVHKFHFLSERVNISGCIFSHHAAPWRGFKSASGKTHENSPLQQETRIRMCSRFLNFRVSATPRENVEAICLCYNYRVHPPMYGSHHIIHIFIELRGHQACFRVLVAKKVGSSTHFSTQHNA